MPQPEIPNPSKKIIKEPKKVQFDISHTSNTMTTQQTPRAEDASDSPIKEEGSEIDIDDQLQSFRMSPGHQTRQDQTPEKIISGGLLNSQLKRDQDEAVPNHHQSSMDILAKPREEAKEENNNI